MDILRESLFQSEMPLYYTADCPETSQASILAKSFRGVYKRNKYGYD